jgi:hypothetical protein
MSSWRTRIDTGLAWSRTLTFAQNGSPLDLSGYTAAATIGALTVATSVDGEAGTVTLSLTAEQTATLPPRQTAGRVDVVSGGGVPLPRIHVNASVR